jgi:hypothetical protein
MLDPYLRSPICPHDMVRNQLSTRKTLLLLLPSNTRKLNRVLPLLRRLAAGFPPRRPAVDAVSGDVELVVDKVEWGPLSSK